MEANSKSRKISPVYKVVKALIQFFYPRIRTEGTENLPDEPVIIVGNHSQVHGPIALELYSPRKRYTWCAGQMMHQEEVAEYAFRDFWSQKPKWTHWFYKLVAHLIPPLAARVFTGAETIEVYKDARIIDTFRTTMKRLEEGADIVIFPEEDRPYNHILYGFQEHFIDLARFYYRKYKKRLMFVPLYLAPKLKTMYYGKPIRFDPDVPIDEERQRIADYLMQEITHMAEALPLHTVIPYRNIPKKLYPVNKPE